MRPWFRQKFQVSGIFKKMFRCGKLVNPQFRRNLKKSKKYNIHMFKKTHISRVSVLHFSSKYLKRISWCFYPTVHQLWRPSSTCLLFLFYTPSLLKYYSKLHHRIKTCVWREFTRKTLRFCYSLKEFHGLTKYVVRPSIKQNKQKPTNKTKTSKQ